MPVNLDTKIVSAKNLATLLALARRVISKQPLTPVELANALGINNATLDKVLAVLFEDGISVHGGLLVHGLPARGSINEEWFAPGDKWVKVGLIADTHLCCREERLEELELQYDLFKREGIKVVYHAGNMVEGFIERINGASVYDITIDGQINYALKHYPQRKGITTKFITGDDHEGWWIKKGFSFGRHMMHAAEKAHRSDLVYIGHVESDVLFTNASGGQTVVKIQHPGGGSAYARSYKAQKQIEAFEGGEKPQILIQGHYHVSNYMQDRNVHVVNMPGFQDQTIFARKKNLRMEVGGAIMEFKSAPDGSVSRFRIEFNRFFTRTYYKNWMNHEPGTLEKSDKVAPIIG